MTLLSHPPLGALTTERLHFFGLGAGFLGFPAPKFDYTAGLGPLSSLVKSEVILKIS